MRKILEKEFLSKRISNLLTNTIAINEFSNTFRKKHIEPHTKEESKDEMSIEDASVISHKAPPAASKTPILQSKSAKNKRSATADQDADVTGQSDCTANSFDISEAKEKIQVIKGTLFRQITFYRFKSSIQKLFQAQLKRIVLSRFSCSHY